MKLIWRRCSTHVKSMLRTSVRLWELQFIWSILLFAQTTGKLVTLMQLSLRQRLRKSRDRGGYWPWGWRVLLVGCGISLGLLTDWWWNFAVAVTESTKFRLSTNTADTVQYAVRLLPVLLALWLIRTADTIVGIRKAQRNLAHAQVQTAFELLIFAVPTLQVPISAGRTCVAQTWRAPKYRMRN